MSKSPQRTGITNLPLHGGKAPAWLFSRMRLLAREITIAIVIEFGPREMLRRLSDPFWFQALGCVLGYDWHSSGVTTVVCGALKEGVKGLQTDLGLYIAGGKGKTSRKTPAEIDAFGQNMSIDPASLIYASRMSAKVDNSALQDGYQLYHHTFFFTTDGAWSVVQQGMNEVNRNARRYHWLSEGVTDFVCEPHSAICSQSKAEVLNLVATESVSARNTISQIAKDEKPEKIIAQLKKIKTLDLPARHYLNLDDIHPDHLSKIFIQTYDRQPENFETLLGLQGVGAKTLRALSLISELVYEVPISGKDGYPYPVDRKTYDKSIEILHQALEKAKLNDTDRIAALRRLKGWL
jgi:hypothetical protein